MPRSTVSERKHRRRARELQELDRLAPTIARARRAELLEAWKRELEARVDQFPESASRPAHELVAIARLYGMAAEMAALEQDVVCRRLGGPGVPSISRTYRRWQK